MSETAKYRSLTVPYCTECGIDIGSGGDPVVPHAISVDLSEDEFQVYNSGNNPASPIHLRGYAWDLKWFRTGVFDFVYSSHLLEDFLDWTPLLIEWTRVLRPGGHLVILVPDKELFAAAIARGQPPNDAHKHEASVGEITDYFMHLGGMEIIVDKRTELFEGDYSILFIGRKL